MMRGSTKLPTEVPGVTPLAEAMYRDAVATTVEMSVDSEVRTKSIIFYRDRQAAENARKIQDGEMTKVQEQLAKWKGDKNSPRELIEQMESIHYELNGNRLEISGTMKVTLLVLMIKAINAKKAQR
jgi:hypothetical protein